jgi:heme/copper-type cytochrome/quinol oxidase subunit 2
MNRFARISSLAIVAIVILVLAAPAFATESTGESDGGATTETTVTTSPTVEGDQPAVVIPPVVIEIEEQPWTARFIYPTIAVVTVLLIAGVAIGYNRRIRKKYQVVG